jgi:hypothetical protein
LKVADVDGVELDAVGETSEDELAGWMEEQGVEPWELHRYSSPSDLTENTQ